MDAVKKIKVEELESEVRRKIIKKMDILDLAVYEKSSEYYDFINNLDDIVIDNFINIKINKIKKNLYNNRKIFFNHKLLGRDDCNLILELLNKVKDNESFNVLLDVLNNDVAINSRYLLDALKIMINAFDKRTLGYLIKTACNPFSINSINHLNDMNLIANCTSIETASYLSEVACNNLVLDYKNHNIDMQRIYNAKTPSRARYLAAYASYYSSLKDEYIHECIMSYIASAKTDYNAYMAFCAATKSDLVKKDNYRQIVWNIANANTKEQAYDLMINAVDEKDDIKFVDKKEDKTKRKATECFIKYYNK